MKKILIVLILGIGIVSFSVSAQNAKKSKIDKTVNESATQNLSFNTITLKLVGTRVSKTDKNKIELEYENFKAIGNDKKIYTEKDFQVNGKNPKIIALVKEWNPSIHLIGFKLLVDVTKEYLIQIARESLEKNQADLIVANDLTQINADQHLAYLVEEKDYQIATHKQEIANFLVEKIQGFDR